ncbi:YhhN-like protein [Flavobacterium sinopsychrotolerans]|uniref:YhhN-like protein n=1 Tax=Flavobacterium sinopsychrotolerans TaxID=604089 RepID=A0A1H8NIV0_9FLAO|nr:hypothetical protein SAMN04487942_2300 [Flavobacterium sinopsychrotolerans]
MWSLFANIGYLILFLNLILFIKSARNYGKAFSIFTWYLGVIFLVQITSMTLKKFNINNLYLSHFYFIGQFILLSLFYINILKGELQKKIVKVCLIIVLLSLAVQYVNDFSLFLKFNLFEIFITSILLILYATFHFYNMLNEKKEFYFINMGILFYLFGSTILFLVGNLTIVLSPKMNKITWILNSILYVLYQIFILVEWKKSFSKKREFKTIL